MIIVRLKGGMGNQMFQYALGRALSLKYNAPLGLDLSFLLDTTPRLNFTFRNYDLDIFNIKAEIVENRKIPFVNRRFKGTLGQILDYSRRFFSFDRGVERAFGFDKKILDIGKDAYLDGYWQSPKYFEAYEDIIRKDFTLKNKLPENIQELKNEIENCNSLCLHVRRGDYVGNKFHEVVNEEYYKKAISIMEDKKVKIDKIYVFSDDIVWCKENLKFGYDTKFVDKEFSGEKAEGHLSLMSSCKNFIIPNSTFSWWGAWLSSNKDKVVIVPKQWFGIKTAKLDIIPEGWERI